MSEATIENGCARVAGGEWLMGLSQPAAVRGAVQVKGLRGLFAPDRASVRAVTAAADCWCAVQERPFLTRFDALPDEPLALVSGKLLVAPLASRTGARSVKLVPFSFSRATAVTEFRKGWAVSATRSRVARVALEDGETLAVRPDAVVAWTGKDPSGFCPKLSLLDVLLPRGPRNLTYTFHGPSTVWFEGAEAARPRRRGAQRIW